MMEMVPTRKAYGKKLVSLGKERQDIVVLDADLSCSTQTGMFAKEYPARFFNVGVSEQDLMGTAAGLAASGKTVFASTFVIFATGRAWEIVRQSIAYPKMNVKVCGTHGGLTVGEDGASHQTVEDIAIMRVIPNMNVIVPADATEVDQVIGEIANNKEPAYVRLSRAASPVLFDSDYKFKLGYGNILKQGSDICLFAIGWMVHVALEVAQELSGRGIDASVVNLASVKPLDREMIVQMSQGKKKVFSLEEHSIIGGLGGAVAEVLSEASNQPPLYRIGVRDEFGQSGNCKEVLAHYKLDVAGVTGQVLEQL